MKFKATVDNIAFAALVFAVVAIAAVSAVATISVENLITTNERALRMQRTISSLEAIRFHSFAISSGEQSYVITGRESDLSGYRAGTAEIEAEVVFLASRRVEHPELERRFEDLEKYARAYIIDGRTIVDTRQNSGQQAATNLVSKHVGSANHENLLQLTQQLLTSARKQMNALEADQIVYGDKVRRLILALISSAAFILVFLYGSLRNLSIAQREAQAKFAYQATHDSLTGLRNRQAVVDYLDKKLADGEQEVSLGGFALLLLDLDGFKAINDSLGHDAGDALLKQVATRIAGALRDSDYVARLGGDEFLVVVPQVSDEETAARVGGKLVSALAADYVLGGGGASSITVSIGISMFPKDARERESLMKCADLALYEAKRAGRNRACFFSPTLIAGTRYR